MVSGHYLQLQTKFGKKSMHAISSNFVVTDTVSPPSARHRQDRLQYTAPLCLARSVTAHTSTHHHHQQQQQQQHNEMLNYLYTGKQAYMREYRQQVLTLA